MRNQTKPNKSEAETKAAIQLARERGEIIDSIDQLVCQLHPEANFSANEIPGGGANLIFYNWSHGKKKINNPPSNQYSCDSCQTEQLPLDQRSVAYECPDCGIVTGYYRQEGDSYGDGAALSSGRGVNYLCRICDTKIGESPFKISR